MPSSPHPGWAALLIIGGEAGDRRRRIEAKGDEGPKRAGGSMVSARDAYDDWYDDDEPYADVEPRRREDTGTRPLSVVRPAPLAFELIRPEDFEVAQRIADRMRDGASVLIDFGGCDRALVGRLTDFASGLVYAIGGSLQHVGGDVILLAPSHMAVSGDEESDVRTPGFYNRV
jgi:cell division inhibitor SepF